MSWSDPENDTSSKIWSQESSSYSFLQWNPRHPTKIHLNHLVIWLIVLEKQTLNWNLLVKSRLIYFGRISFSFNYSVHFYNSLTIQKSDSCINQSNKSLKQRRLCACAWKPRAAVDEGSTELKRTPFRNAALRFINSTNAEHFSYQKTLQITMKFSLNCR